MKKKLEITIYTYNQRKWGNDRTGPPAFVPKQMELSSPTGNGGPIL
jgi:hypothetical protein